PCLEAWYVPRLAPPTSPPIDEQLTIAPLPCVRIWRSSNFMQRHTPRRLMDITRSKPGSISGFRNNILNAGIVVSCIKPPEGSDALSNHCLHLSVISHIALDSQCFVALSSQFLCRRADCFSIPIRKHHCSTRFCKSLRRGKA